MKLVIDLYPRFHGFEHGLSTWRIVLCTQFKSYLDVIIHIIQQRRRLDLVGGTRLDLTGHLPCQAPRVFIEKGIGKKLLGASGLSLVEAG